MTRVIITQSAPAKMNLYLHVTGKRADGYHLLDSAAVFADDIADIVTLEESDVFSFSISGEFAADTGDTDHNLAVRAARLYGAQTKTDLKLSLHLEKHIPAGAGLGGGSADAAAVIKALETFYRIDLPDCDRHLLSLGADVPVCYHGRPCRFQGIGEAITDIPPLPSIAMLIVWPGVHSSTKDVFAARASAYQSSAAIPSSIGSMQALIQFLSSTENGLENVAIGLNPPIEKARSLLKQQDGCLFARMSGSGSAVFGLFASVSDAARARDEILAIHPHWWVKTTQI